MATKKRASRSPATARSVGKASKKSSRTSPDKSGQRRVSDEADPPGHIEQSESRLVGQILANLSVKEERAKRKMSVTVDANLWEEVSRLVMRDAAPTTSSAVESALAMWAANQRLRELLEEIYEESPAARPTESQVTAAAEVLGMR